MPKKTKKSKSIIKKLNMISNEIRNMLLKLYLKRQ